MSRSAELFRFLGQLRITDLIDFVIVWAIVYGLLKLVRGTRAVQMAVGLLGVGLLYQISVILGLDTLQFVMRNTLLYFGFAILVIYWQAWQIRRRNPGVLASTTARRGYLARLAIGVALLVLDGWLGGHLVYSLRLGVNP